MKGITEDDEMSLRDIISDIMVLCVSNRVLEQTNPRPRMIAEARSWDPFRSVFQDRILVRVYNRVGRELQK